MSHPTGTYLNGIRTIEDLRQRCYVDSDTGCWHWRLSINQGSPRVHIYKGSGKSLVMRGRRAALYLKRGHDLPHGFVAYATVSCQSEDCCNPDHARSGNRMAHGRALAQSGKVKNLPAKIAASRNTSRTKLAKLDMEKAREIRASSLSIAELAKKYGVTKHPIYQIRIGAAWVENLPNSSVFSISPVGVGRDVQTGGSW